MQESYNETHEAPKLDPDEDSESRDKAELARFWIGQIKTSQDESRVWQFEARAAWREYQGEGLDGQYRKLIRFNTNSYNRYWSDTMVMLPALLGPQPNPVGIKKFPKDPIANTAAIMIEDIAAFLIEDSDFERCRRKARLEYLHASRATARVYFRCDFVKRKIRVLLTEQETIETDEQGVDQPVTVLVDPDGVEVRPEDKTILTDEEGLPYYEKEEEEEVENPRILVKTNHFDEVLIAPGVRDTDQLWWRAYLVRDTKKNARELFGPMVDMVQGQDQTVSPDYDDGLKDSKELFSYWEVWDFKTKRIICVNELITDKPLKVEDDPYELVGFYPSPRDMLINERYSDLYPVPDFTLTRDGYQNLHLLAKRINNVAKAIKGSCLFDGSYPEIEQMMNEIGDGMGVAMAGFKDLMANGGLDGLMMFPPYERLAATLDKLIQAFEMQKADLDQLRGISDIVRGTSEVGITATAERIKQMAARNKFSMREKEAIRFDRDLLESMCDLALKTFPDLKIKEIVGYPYMDPEDQANFEAALVMLRDPRTRMVRIDLETDASNALNQQDAEENANKMLGAVAQFVPTFTQAAKETPALAPILFKVLEIGLSSFRYGKHAEDELKQTFDAIREQMNTPPPPPPPVPPDYEAEKLQIEAQKNQADTQIAMQKIELESAQQQFEQWKEQQEVQLDWAKHQLDERKEMFEEQFKIQGQQIDMQTFDLKMREMFMEEQRLSIQNIQIPEERMHERAVSEAKGPKSPVTINLVQSAPLPPEPAQPAFVPSLAPTLPPLY